MNEHNVRFPRTLVVWYIPRIFLLNLKNKFKPFKANSYAHISELVTRALQGSRESKKNHNVVIRGTMSSSGISILLAWI